MNAVLLFLFFLSGAVSLVYEVLWVRSISVLTGSGDFSVTIILGIFMTGLATGSFIAGRFVDRISDRHNLLRLYGVLEILIGVYVLFLPLLFNVSRPLYSMAYNRFGDSMIMYGLASSGITMFLLGFPCTLMGASLPILCRWGIRSTLRSGRITGLLYGLNTLGASVGTVSCWYVLIFCLGMFGTQIFSACTNMGIGIICICMWYWIKRLAHQSSPVKDTAPLKIISKSNRWVWFILFASGFSTMAYEVIWTRLLALLVGPTTYSLTIILFSFIVGIGIGSILFGWMSDRVKNPFLLIVWTQLAISAFALAASQFLGGGQLFFAKLLYVASDDFNAGSVQIAIVITLLLLPSTVCMGGIFPAANKILIKDIGTTARDTGNNYFINTLGAVAGTFCAGFLFIPIMGKADSISLVVALQVISVLIFALSCRKKYIRGRIYAVSVAGLVVLVCAYFIPSWNYSSLTRARYQRFSEFEDSIMNSSYWSAAMRGDSILTSSQPHEDVLYLADGVGGFVSVNKSIDSLGVTNLTLTTSGKKDASTVVDVRTQVLSGHLPMLFGTESGDVMVVGLGSGMTAGEVLNYPVRTLDILEISPEVVSACELFRPWNNGVLDDSRASIILQDARTHLSLTGRKYDVIISEPSNCWLAGMSNLFTVEFFQKVRKCLKNGGVFEQWLYSYQMTWEDFSMITRSINSVFPNSLLFRTGTRGPDYLVLSFSESDAVLNMDTAKERLKYLNQSCNIKLSSPDLLHALIVSDDLSLFSGPGLLNTDNHPYLEYSAPRNINVWQSGLSDTIAEKGAIVSDHIRTLSRPLNGDDQIAMVRFMISLGVSPFGLVDKDMLSANHLEEYHSLIESFSSKNMIVDYFGIRDTADRRLCAAVHQKKILSCIQAWSTANTPSTQMGTTFHDLGNTYLVTGEYQVAERCYRQALSYLPDNTASLYALGITAQAEGNYSDAIDAYERLIHLNVVSDRINNRLKDCRSKLKQLP